MTTCRVHLSIALLFSKCHLHGSLVIKVINTVESPVHSISEREGEQSKEGPRKTSTTTEVPFAYFTAS